MLLSLLSLVMTAHAGGAHAEWRVTAFSQAGAQTVFSLRHTESAPMLLDQCDEITVQVAYAMVPTYAWLPFVETLHPSRAETDQGLALIRAAHQRQQTLLFGVMGSGLEPAGAPCVFQSRGLELYSQDGHTILLSFYRPV